MTVNSYGSLYAIGHRAIRDLFEGEVVIQEKVDGSQFSFQIKNGEIECRSKGAQLNVVAPDKMFSAGVEVVKSLADKLQPGFVYRGEYLQRPKHNTLVYDRTPNNHIILFDIEDTNLGEGYFLSPVAMQLEAQRLGLEVVPTLFHGRVENVEVLRKLLDTVSVLGGQKIEGVVVKNYAKFTDDKKVMMGKFVSEAFKEVHQGEWKKNNPTQSDIMAQLVASYKTPARWAKAVQHLKEAGKIEGSPKDIGHIIKEVGEDVERECKDDIKQVLYDYFWPQLRRQLTGGLPEWYKEQVMQLSFSENK